MRKILIPRHPVLMLLTFLGFTQSARSQIMADTLGYSFHKYFAPVFREKKVKRMYYTLEYPYLISGNYVFYGKRKKGKGEYKWGKDTILTSHNYDTSGFYKSRVDTKPDGSLYKKIEYFFNDAGALKKIITTDSSRYSAFNFQEQELIYEDGRLAAIKKITVRNGETINSVLTFHYSWDKLIQAIELTDKGKLLLSSFFTYDKDRNYITEHSVIIDVVDTEIRATWYYTVDDKDRISKVYGSYKNFKRKKKPVKEFKYDFVKEAYIFETGLKKIEWYN